MLPYRHGRPGRSVKDWGGTARINRSMSDTKRAGAVRHSELPLSPAQLTARRAGRRRHRRHRRVAGFAALVVVLGGVFLVLHGAGSGGQKAVAARPAPVAAPQRLPRAVRHHAVSFQRPVDRVLRYTSYVRVAGTRRRDVALTFDDGPGLYTHSILKILERTRTPATFFVVGEWARAYPRLVADEARGGFEVGDHTETHAYLTELSPAGQRDQITDAAHAIRRAGAPAPVLFRPPYGSFNPETLSLLRAQRLLMVLWSVDTSDYARPGAAKIIFTALSGAAPGAIILMHDGGGDRSQTVAALPRIITRLRQRGFHLATVSQLVADDPPPRGQPPPQPLSGTP
jgi:peptidoglycan-N-acetylglucosamine deacetylase